MLETVAAYMIAFAIAGVVYRFLYYLRNIMERLDKIINHLSDN